MVTLGMLARVSLGHSGRPIQPPLLTILAFILLNVSSLLRVEALVFFTSSYGTLILLSGSVWILAFSFFLWNYSPILTAHWIDGRHGGQNPKSRQLCKASNAVDTFSVLHNAVNLRAVQFEPDFL